MCRTFIIGFAVEAFAAEELTLRTFNCAMVYSVRHGPSPPLGLRKTQYVIFFSLGKIWLSEKTARKKMYLSWELVACRPDVLQQKIGTQEKRGLLPNEVQRLDLGPRWRPPLQMPVMAGNAYSWTLAINTGHIASIPGPH